MVVSTNRKKTTVYFSLLILSLTFSSVCYAVIPISSIEELQKIGNDPAYSLSDEYELTQDINARDTIYWNGGKGFAPIGDYYNPFLGKFDGKGYKISNLYINRPGHGSNYIGIFGAISTGSEIKNVAIDNCWIIGNEHVGSLIAYMFRGTVTNCYSTGFVLGGQRVGGLIGTYSETSPGTITGCFSKCNVSGQGNVGGFIGYAETGCSITRCYAMGSVTGAGNLTGGFIGYNRGTVEKSFSFGSVSGSAYIGGFAGESNRNIINCYSIGSVKGNGDNLGGFIGHCSYATTQYSYSTGQVIVNGSGTTYGGFIGKFDSFATNDCYWDIESSGQSNSSGGTGKTTAEMKQQSTFENWDFTEIWGIEEEVTYPYLLWQKITMPDWTNTPEITARIEVISKGLFIGSVKYECSNTIEAGNIIRQEPDPATEIYAGNSVNLVVSLGPCTEGEGVIEGEPEGSTEGEPEPDAIPIDTIEKLQMIGNDAGYPLNGKYYLVNNIDATETISWNDGKGFAPIGNYYTPFVGKFDGRGKKISNLYINRPDHGSNFVGIFGAISSDAEIKNVFIDNCWILGYDYVGSLVGYMNEGMVSQCHATGTVSGKNRVGGLIGTYPNTYSGSIISCSSKCNVSGVGYTGGFIGHTGTGCFINSCYSMGSVTGTGSLTGGFIGYNEGMINNSFSTGSVTGSNYVGGFAGQNSRYIMNCYSTGSVRGNGENLGGFIGYGSYSTTRDCYSTGQVIVEGAGTSYGGFIGKFDGYVIDDCYWDIESSGQTISAGGTGKTTAELKQQSTYENWGFGIMWDVLNGETKPYLLAIPAAIPDVVGVILNTARAMIEENELIVGEITEECSETIPSGCVIRTSPPIGQTLNPGFVVNVVVSTGRCPVEVPNCIGLTENEAQTALETAGLVLGTVTQRCNNTVAQNLVSEQTPQPGQMIPGGSSVNIVISTGPCITVPNFIGMTQTIAEGTITSSGLTVGSITEQCNQEIEAGIVLEQTPLAGSDVEPGTTVNLVISTGPCKHSADQNGDRIINLTELLRVIQFFNSGGLHCETGTEDGYAPGLNGDHSCKAHNSDYNQHDWIITLSELLRLIQFFNSGGYHACPDGEDGYCPGL